MLAYLGRRIAAYNAIIWRNRVLTDKNGIDELPRHESYGVPGALKRTDLGFMRSGRSSASR